MNITEILQKGINYMELHLMEDITYEDVAKHVNMSVFQFHRTFAIIAGISASEYIRCRRLSLAGEEVIGSDRKIIDIAFDYGFTRPESFTKAFTRFHGVTPRAARKMQTDLKVFSPLHIKIVLKGGITMHYRIEKREPFKFIAKVRNFDIRKTNEAGNTEISDFWKEEMDQGLFDQLSLYAKNKAHYGACSALEKDNNCFEYGIAMEYSGGKVPPEYSVWKVEHKTWAVFKCIGDSPECIGDVWEQILSEFLPGSEYTRVNTYDFEYYPEKIEDGLFCEIWIPVKK